jgi:MFS family permease
MSSPRSFQVGSIFASYAAAGVYWGSYVAALPAFKLISGLSEAQFGLLMTLTTIGGIIAMQAMGRVLHRVQAIAIPVCLLAFAAGMVLFGVAAGPWSLGLAMFLSGAASGALDISLNMRVARIEADFDIRLFNRVHALFPVAMLLTSVSVGALRDWGLAPAQIFPPAAVILAAVAVLERQAGRHQVPAAGANRGAGLRLNGLLVIMGAMAALGAIMEGGAHTWSALFVEGALGASPLIGGLAAAAITLGLTTGRLLAHALEHRFADMVIVRASALMAVPAFVMLALAPAPWVALVGLYLAGIGIGPVEPAIFRSVARRNPEATRGRALALATGLAYIGYLSAPPVMGTVIEQAGWPWMWLSLILFGLAASALTFRVPPQDRG